LMVMGFGISYYFATGVNSKALRSLSIFTSFLCMAGAILAFARGAMLALLVVLMTLLLRSHRRLVFLGYGSVAILVGLAVIQIAFPGGQFWAEMQTIQEVDSEEGRLILWGLAWKLFVAYPILGVGPGNFGPNAAEFFTGRLGGGFDDPAMLYFWELHNDFVKILAEQGLVGVFAMGAMLVGFNNRLRMMRTEGARNRWRESTGGYIDLYILSLALEVGMVGFLANSFFYNQLYMHWFWSIFSLAYVVANVSRTSESRLFAHSTDGLLSRGQVRRLKEHA